LESVENSLKAFKRCEKLGIDIIETDVQFSKDKQVVVMHDDFFKRTCGEEGRPQERNFEDFPPFLDEIPVHFTPGTSYVRKPTDDKGYCLLEDVFRELKKETVLHIEIKEEGNQEFKQAVVDLVEKYDRSEYTVLGCV
jgi:glycerophosphoryl diester phosphodiesterase